VSLPPALAAVMAVLITASCTENVDSTGAGPLSGSVSATREAVTGNPPASSPNRAQQHRAGHTPVRVRARRTVVAAGDIACEPGQRATRTQCRQRATARLAKSFRPRYVLALGDLQYDEGALPAFRRSYDRSWGALKPVTRPVPGNHEYRTPGAAGYFRYFGQSPGSRGYYTFSLKNWRIYALNSNCDAIDCTRQVRWLARNLRTHPRRCTMLTMHHPRYSSGPHGSDPSMSRFWRVALRHRADVALAGHDHVYERLVRMNANGQRDRRGIASFVVGTGGSSLYQFENVVRGSAVRHNTLAGVLALKLGRAQYSWVYKTIDGAVHDRGTRRCQ
jgi:3',5'-cyclic AMP phosphodiesterase CpdA